MLGSEWKNVRIGFHIFPSQVNTSTLVHVFSAFPTKQSVTTFLKYYNTMEREIQEHSKLWIYWHLIIDYEDILTFSLEGF